MDGISIQHPRPAAAPCLDRYGPTVCARSPGPRKPITVTLPVRLDPFPCPLQAHPSSSPAFLSQLRPRYITFSSSASEWMGSSTAASLAPRDTHRIILVGFIMNLRQQIPWRAMKAAPSGVRTEYGIIRYPYPYPPPVVLSSQAKWE